VTAEPPRRSSRSSTPRRRRHLGAAAGRQATITALLATAVALVLALLAGTPAAAAADFVVVVHTGNSQSALPAAEISKLFLHRITLWSSSERVMPVDLTEDSPVRASFSRAIHERSTAAVKAYWQKMIFSGRDVPPPEKSSAAEVLAYVRANPGAIGYVPAGTALPDGVKAVRVTQ
jgi:ABC-type phosphate transport system substrate-binding protein